MLRPIQQKLGLPLWTFVIATTVSFAGGFIQKIAVGWSAWEMTHATNLVAAAALADLLPTLILSIPAGAVVDRLGPAKVFWIGLIASALQAVALYALTVTGHLTFGALIACAIFLGACNAFTGPSRIAYGIQLAPPGTYSRLVALSSIGGNAALFVGPMAGGELLRHFGAASAFLANALAYLPMVLVAISVSKIATNEEPPVTANGPAEEVGFLRKIYEGFRFAIGNREILLMLLAFAAAAVMARGIVELAPSIAATALLGDVSTLSYLTSSIAFGAIVAGLWMSRGSAWLGPATIPVTLSGAAIALLGYGASGQFWLALAGAALLGFMLAVNNIAATSAVQLNSPPAFRGRINSLYNMIFKGGPAIGAITFGTLAQATDVRVSSVAAAVTLVILMIAIVKLMHWCTLHAGGEWPPICKKASELGNQGM